MYGPRKGFAQSQYYDQQATALPGMLANASDINLCDSAFISDTYPEGLTAGTAVCAVPATKSNRPGVNFAMVRPMYPNASGNDIAGIVVRNQWMRTNDNGEACLFKEDICNILRTSRIGGRIWVKLVGTETTIQNGKVYCVINDTAEHGYTIGAFSAAPISGTVTPTAGMLLGGTFAYNGSAVEGGVNAGFDITIDGTLYKVTGIDLTRATTISAVATAVQAGLDDVSAPATVSVEGNALAIVSNTTGTSSSVTVASAPTASDSPWDASAYLGFTLATGAQVIPGSAGSSNDTVEVPGARFMGTFTPNEDPALSVALIEFGLN